MLTTRKAELSYDGNFRLRIPDYTVIKIKDTNITYSAIISSKEFPPIIDYINSEFRKNSSLKYIYDIYVDPCMPYKERESLAEIIYTHNYYARELDKKASP